MNTLGQDWILPLYTITITCIGFAIVAYVIFFRHVQIKTSLICSTFIIPLIITTYSLVFQKNLNISHVIAISEIEMMLVLIGLSIILKYKLRFESLMLVNTLAIIALCIALTNVHFRIFITQEFQIYHIISFVLTSFFVILTRKTNEAKLTKSFSFLGISQFLTLFQLAPIPCLTAFVLKLYFYILVTKLLFKSTYEEIMKEVVEAREIKKEFDDALRKEVKKHIFYMELSQEKMAIISQTDALTEAYNRKGIMDQIDRLVENPKINLFSILMFDIDKFKNINDTLGHSVGDKCLKTLSKIARGNLRPPWALRWRRIPYYPPKHRHRNRISCSRTFPP
jgi:predicted signal transduction protein with EAL and GGDEF domain